MGLSAKKSSDDARKFASSYLMVKFEVYSKFKYGYFYYLNRIVIGYCDPGDRLPDSFTR